MPTHRSYSRTETTSNELSFEAINAGSLQRIADATEIMAKNHAQLIRERDQYERWYNQEHAKRKALERSITAYKANITRFRRQIAELKENAQ